MGLTDFFKRGPSAEEQIQKAGFEISACSAECESCTSAFPKSLSFKDDDNASLLGSTSPYGLHAIVPTNKSDWPHNATGESKTLAHMVDKWAGDAKFAGLGESTKIKVTVSSLSSLKLESDAEYMDQKRGDVLLLPFFVWVRNVTIENAGKVLDRVVPDLIKYRDQQVTELPDISYAEFPEVEVKPDPSKAYVFFCSHRTRDKKCGVTAPIMKREMDMHLRDLGLYRDFSDDRPGGVQVAFVNHIGGHKYAANVIIYLKSSGKNIWLARCKPSNVVPIIDQCIVEDGKVWPEKVRQVQKFKAVEW
ncbi:hypothetical protein OXX59_004226 [Metschnikowia pulcherrima]